MIVTGKDAWKGNATIREWFEVVVPDVGTWKFQCRRCSTLLPHQSDYRDLLDHGFQLLG
jgi:hypothetical protein